MARGPSDNSYPLFGYWQIIPGWRSVINTLLLTRQKIPDKINTFKAMIIDHLNQAQHYYTLNPGIELALRYLQTTDFTKLENGKYELDGDNLLAIVQEYDTKDPATEKLESHKKYIDVQYVVSGREKMGHALLQAQVPSRLYNPEDDFMLFDEAPDFFSLITEGMFTIFYPTDLHMPCILHQQSSHVRKVVMKVSVDYIRDTRQSL